MATFLYQQIASLVVARAGEKHWYNRYPTQEVQRLVKLYTPGTIDLDRSTGNKLVFHYQHMNDAGCEDDVTNYTVTVKPDLSRGFTLTVNGSNRKRNKDYIADIFDCALRERMT